jgi:anaerobic ribonucleoside-triphosphate reductase activating protein
MSTPIRISRLHFPIETLGPGRRLGIWVQGCSIHCPGCISLDTWSEDRGDTTVEAVLTLCDGWLSEADGVTISGGEPFDQPTALKALLVGIRAEFAGDVLVYSGHSLEELPLAEFQGLIDTLISDPLDIRAPQTLPWRGSDNQRLTHLTALGQARFEAHPRPKAGLDVMFDDATGAVFMAGIPRRGDLRRLQAILERAGHAATVSEDKRYRDE